jgi:hypothetical protein
MGSDSSLAIRAKHSPIPVFRGRLGVLQVLSRQRKDKWQRFDFPLAAWRPGGASTASRKRKTLNLFYVLQAQPGEFGN